MRPLCDEVLSLLRDHDFEWETFPQIFGDFCGFTKDVRSVITRATSDPGFFLKRGHRQITIQRIDDRICYYLGKTDVAKWDLTLHADEIGFVLTIEEVVALAKAYLLGKPLPGAPRSRS